MLFAFFFFNLFKKKILFFFFFFSGFSTLPPQGENSESKINQKENQNLRPDLARRDDEVGADGEQHRDEPGPGDEALRAELVGTSRLGPGVGGVDRRVAVDVGLLSFFLC